MTVEQQVRAAVDRGRPGEALLVLARAVDELRSRPSNETAEDWTLPPATSTELDDPDERAAREAQQRLARDAGRAMPDIGVQRADLVAVLTDNGVEISVPPAPDDVRAQRWDFARSLGLDKPGWWSRRELAIDDPDTAVRAYVVGGPLWLHAYDRDFVRALPEATRRQMVRDVESYSPASAHDLSRDILRDTDPTSAREIQTRGA